MAKHTVTIKDLNGNPVTCVFDIPDTVVSNLNPELMEWILQAYTEEYVATLQQKEETQNG